MLSNTAETKPKPKVVRHDAAGSSSTGIIDAAVTRASRKIVPLKASGSTFQSGRRNGAVANRTAQTDKPNMGTRPSNSGKWRLVTTFTNSATIKMATTINTRIQSIATPRRACLARGEWRSCCKDAGTAKITNATIAATYASSTLSGLTHEAHLIAIVL